MLCKKCGAKIPDGASFCEKCGKPIQDIAKKRKKKGVIIGGCVGVLVLVVVTIGILFVTGMMGDKKDGVQANADILVSQESPSVTEEEVTGIEAEKKNEQESQETDADNARDKAWEAFEAYKIYVEQKERDEAESEEGYAGDEEEYEEELMFAFIYLDSDDYPELLWGMNQGTGYMEVYTYKNGEVISTGFSGGTYFSYKERRNYIYCSTFSGEPSQTYAVIQGAAVKELYSESSQNAEELKSAKEIAKITGVSELSVDDWNTPNLFETIDEAFTETVAYKWQ